MSGCSHPKNDIVRKKNDCSHFVLNTKPCPSSCIPFIAKFAWQPYSDVNIRHSALFPSDWWYRARINQASSIANQPPAIINP